MRAEPGMTPPSVAAWRCRLGLLSLAVALSSACKTNGVHADNEALQAGTPKADSPGGAALADGSAAKASAPKCQESCAGTFASAKLMGCVLSCEQWQGKTLAINAGHSQYPALPAAPHCTFTYEARDANQVQAGAFSQLYSFGFRFSDGVGDGSFLITGSGMTDPAALLDFARASDQKNFNHDDLGVTTTLNFLRQDPKQNGAPSVTIQEMVREDNETKTLVLVLDRDFAAATPFAHLRSAAFSDRIGQLVRQDIVCQP